MRIACVLTLKKEDFTAKAAKTAKKEEITAEFAEIAEDSLSVV